MASKTAARSAARTTRSKASSRGGARSSRPAAPRRKPARQKPSAVSAAGTAVGRGMRAGWLMVAKG
ncbi:MAG: hypothetical protein WBB00_30725, partial [Mycobacterium sp.]